LVCKTVDDFSVHPKSESKGSPKNRHQADLLESEANLAEVRFRHHENRRKSKSRDLFINNHSSVFIVLVMRIYEYLCVMSTIPTLNPALGTNINSKSKTTLNSGGGNAQGLTHIGMKSNRDQVSLFKADKHLVNHQLSRIGRDEMRQNFSCLVSNLPQIQKKPIRVKTQVQPASSTVSKKVKRKESVPKVIKMAHSAHS